MTSFLNALQVETNLTTTENGAVTNKSSLDPVVDFFGLAGAKRDRPHDAVDLYELAFAADPLTATRTLFYLRDVRGGQGEREVFRQCLTWLRLAHPDAYKAVLTHIPFYGRWDDIFHDGVTNEVIDLIDLQLDHDTDAYLRGESISLLAKWMPSENASSPRTKRLARQIIKLVDTTPREYRQALVQLRSHIRLLEHKMSANEWESIEYGKLPSQAHRRHVKAFQRHTPERYQEYLDSVKKGEAKINVKAVYPYEIWQMVRKGEVDYANVAWENLPDYTRGNNALVMADTSSSMTWYNNARAMAVSVSLALYFAERNTGPFKGYYMSFASEPTLVKVTGSTLAQRMAAIERGPVGGSTNLLGAFRAILQAGRVAPEEMPKVLYVISDMEFDSATRSHAPQQYTYQTRMVMGRTPWGNLVYAPQQIRVPVSQPQLQSKDTVFQTAKAEFAAAGLELPHVVFWNVEARQNQAPATTLDGQVSLVSGLSPTTFSQTVEGKTPRELVDAVVNAERYERIVL